MIRLFLFFSLLSQALPAHETTATYKNTNYVSLSLGLADLKQAYPEKNFAETAWSFNNGNNLALALGKDYGLFRIEADLSYRRFDFNAWNAGPSLLKGNGHQNQISMMFNGLWQPLTNWLVSPYIGAGLGLTHIAWNKVNTGNNWHISDHDTVFSYQFILGLNYQINKNYSLSAQYQNLNPGDIEITGSDDITGKITHQGMQIYGLSVRRNF